MKITYNKAEEPVHWSEIFTNSNPIELELGCGRPHYILEKAILHPEINFIGIEYKSHWVNHAQEKITRLRLKNIHMLCGNARNILPSLIPDNFLNQLTIQFPDPWFKRRHFKRRLLDVPFTQILANKLQNRGMIFLQSDVKELFDLYLNLLENCPGLHNSADKSAHLKDNPMSVKSHREKKCILKELPVYRVLIQKIL